MKGLIGKKLGMTQVFKDTGEIIPVTMIQAGPCSVVQLKTVESDSYQAVQLAFGTKKESRSNKPEAGHYNRAGLKPMQVMKEFRDYPLDNVKLGGTIAADIFKIGEKLDVTGNTKGKGFAGVMKRHGFGAHKATHGTHESFRGPGSIGMHTWPGRVWRGKRMAGRMGNAHFTVRNLEIVRLEAEKNIIMVRGAIPGPNGGIVELRLTKKV